MKTDLAIVFFSWIKKKILGPRSSKEIYHQVILSLYQTTSIHVCKYLKQTPRKNFQHSQTQKMCKVVTPLSETPLILPECLTLTQT